jgi:hypothetical protein
MKIKQKREWSHTKNIRKPRKNKAATRTIKFRGQVLNLRRKFLNSALELTVCVLRFCGVPENFLLLAVSWRLENLWLLELGRFKLKLALEIAPASRAIKARMSHFFKLNGRNNTAVVHSKEAWIILSNFTML